MTKTIRNSLIVLILIIAVALMLSAFGIFSSKELPSKSEQTASIIVISPSGSIADVGRLENVKWTSGAEASPEVSVAIIRKVSDNPARYELVRTVASATKNDGSAVWVPAKSDMGSNTLVQVGCTLTPNACSAGVSSNSLAVVDDGRYANTASTYQAIEALENQ